MSSAQIGNLNVRLGLDTAEFSAGARGAQATLGSLTNSIRGFGAGIVGALSLGALASAVDDVIHKVAEIGDVAESIGITAEQLQVYNRMALASGSSSEAMAKGLQSVAEQSTDAGSALSKLFAANGLSAQGQSVNDTIRMFMDLLRNAKDPAEQLAMATNVLGTRVGRDLVESFRAGAAGVDESTKAMVESGNYFSDAEIARVQDIETRYNQVMANIATGWQRMVVGIIDGLNAISQAAPEPGGKFNRMGWDLSQPAFSTPLLPPTVNMGPMGGPGQFPKIPAKVTVLPPAKEQTAAVKASITKEVTPDPINPVPPDTIDSIYGAGEAFQTLWNDMAQGVDQTSELDDAFQDITSTLSDELGYAFSGIISGTESVSEAFGHMAQGISQELAQIAVQMMSSEFMKLFSMLAGGLTGGGAGFNILGMTFGGIYADGGTLGAGKWGIAGEAGPEIIHGPASITPTDRMGGSPQVNVQIVNNSSAKVSAQQQPDGSLKVMVEEVVANALRRGGNKIDSAMASGYGLRRAGR